MDPIRKIEKAQKALLARGVTVLPRMDYYQGRHPSQLGSDSWNRSFRNRLAYLIDNQCKLAVDTISEAVVPSAFKPVVEDTTGEVYAAWATDLVINKHATTTAKIIRDAEASGDQVTVLIDVDEETREVGLYPLEACYVEQTKGGAYKWAVFFWKDDLDLTHATVLEPGRDLDYPSQSTSAFPGIDEFGAPLEYVRPYTDLMIATVNKGDSVIDDIRGLNDLLNKSLQTQAVVGEAYALPFRVWLGIETYDPETGTRRPLPTLNPATGSRDIILPTGLDPEGAERKVLQFESPTPSAFLEEQDALRAAIARLASIPAFMLQLGGNPPSGDALEQAYMPFITAKAANERYYAPFFARIARLAVQRYVFEVTGRMPAPVDFATTFSTVSTSTLTSRIEHVRSAVSSGMTLRDALIEFLGWSEEAADEVAGRSEAQADRRANLSDQGLNSLGI